ncbi:M28 family metallopeptidase [Frigoribacterium faeni]|uniref:Peptidase M28 domain-containing protein n=1 Tax=Frigoribacterium faeni TaxID=145483 RepID=A0A7W3PJQ6_9MICO|nr:M20/M25/M40 family metallo-hydrolase [Frigoribacterium faeni]MBA8814077.1 hypothetical protein [Frigoribacterium faeni]GEK82669.1 hypothetical protein FFA01_09780 [Frigoribacterium faeni]
MTSTRASSASAPDTDPDVARAYDDLVALVQHGPRFHGTPGIAAAADWLEGRLTAVGLSVDRQSVALPGWQPGTVHRLVVRSPIERELPAWPMLWSGSTDGAVRGTVESVGPQGLWGDSMVWRKFVVRDDAGRPVAYLHARDGGPAAPQPLPAGSDLDVAHLAIGRLDGLQLTEWLDDGRPVVVEAEVDSGPVDAAVSDNLIVDLAAADGGSDPARGTVLLCAHYDTFFNTVGAYDNGSGTIALLELAERWAAKAPAVPVRLVFFTAEEWHLGGSRHHLDAASAADLEAIDYVLNIDGLGRGSFVEAFAGPEAFSTAFRDALMAYAAGTRPDLELVTRFPPTVGTDDASFHRAGVPSAFLTFNDLHRLHQPDDEPNLGIAANIAWTVPLAEHLVATLPRPTRVAPPGIL